MHRPAPPTLDLTATAPDGRRLGVRQVGDPDGSPVVLCHPAPGSRALDPDPAVTAAAGVRLITVDRPGYGDSDPIDPGVVPAIPTFATDLAVVLDHLGVPRAAVVGWSAGGRVALALAGARPDLVSATAVVATPAPHEAVPWIPDEQVAMIEAFQDDPVAGRTAIEQALAPMAADPEAAVASVGVTEASPEQAERLAEMLAVAFVQGAAGVAADITSYTLAPWGFDLGDVRGPVRAFYGAADPIGTPAHGAWYVDQLPDATLVVVDGADHGVALTAWDRVLAAVLGP